MPDWQKLVRARLSQLSLGATERDEIHAELAAHLEDSYEFLLQRGWPAQEAVERTLAEVPNWQELRKRIHRAKLKEHDMTDRVRQLWLPSLFTMLFSMGLLMLIQLYGPNPWIAARKSGWSLIAPVAVVYVPWLLSLPLIGAVGAYLSIRAGASQRVIFSSVLSPVLPYLAFFLIGLPTMVILNDHVKHNIMFSAFFVGFFAWVVAPGAALLAGALLTQVIFSRGSAHRSVRAR